MADTGITIRMNASENTMTVYGKEYHREDKGKLLISNNGEVAFYEDVRDHVCEMRGIS